MSRIGKKPIEIPEGVEAEIKDNIVVIKGPKGELSQKIRPEIGVELKQGKIFVQSFLKKDRIKTRDQGQGEVRISRRTSKLTATQVKKTKAFWGLTRSLLSNMIEGVTKGYKKELEIHGLGFKAKLEENDLVIQLGFTHPVIIKASQGIQFSVKKNIITVSGINKGLVGQVAARIRAVKPPEPYKGKGIRYVGEIVRRKEGKKAATTG